MNIQILNKKLFWEIKFQNKNKPFTKYHKFQNFEQSMISQHLSLKSSNDVDFDKLYVDDKLTKLGVLNMSRYGSLFMNVPQDNIRTVTTLQYMQEPFKPETYYIVKIRNNKKKTTIIPQNRQDILAVLIHTITTQRPIIVLNVYFWYYPWMVDLLILLSKFCTVSIGRIHRPKNFTRINHSIMISNITSPNDMLQQLKLCRKANTNVSLNEQFLALPPHVYQQYLATIDAYFNTYIEFKMPYYLKYAKNTTLENLKALNTIYKEQNLIYFINLKYNVTVMGKQYIQNIIQSKIMTTLHSTTKLHSNVNPREGDLLSTIIKDHQHSNVLEIGMAYGVSSMYMLIALQDNKHQHNLPSVSLTSIDPNQSTQWKNIGVDNVAAIKMTHHHTLIEEVSEIALPMLWKASRENKSHQTPSTQYQYDLIFIDGFHTFDNTLMDVYFAVRLVKMFGFIIIDDIQHPGVKHVSEYINTNYKHLKRINYADPVFSTNKHYTSKTMGIYQKISKDTRTWDFHKAF